MLSRSFRVGRILGFTITVNASFLLLLGLWWLQAGMTAGSLIQGFVWGTLSLITVFGSVLLHELGHALVARRLGIGVAEIELHFFGGAAKMTSMPRSPRDEIVMAAAGPAVSFALFALATAASSWLTLTRQLGLGGLVEALSTLGAVNLMLGTFNLIPALPMDGGRILRAALTPRFGAWRATRIAVTVARVAAILMAGVALASQQLFLLAVAFFIWTLGTQELRLADMVRGLQPGLDVFDRDGRFVTRVPLADDAADPWRDTVGPSAAWDGSTAGASVDTQLITVHGPDGRLWVVSRRTVRNP